MSTPFDPRIEAALKERYATLAAKKREAATLLGYEEFATLQEVSTECRILRAEIKLLVSVGIWLNEN